jgi:hypothetical protein
VQIDNITIDMNGAHNAVNVTNGADILLLDCADCSVHDVTAIHSHHTGAFGFSLYGSGTSTNNVWDRNTIHGWGSGDSTTCGGGIFVQSSGGRITNNYADNLCDAAYIANGQVANPSTQISDVLIANNTWIYGASNSAVLLSGAFTDESANHTQFVGNTCSGPTNSGCSYRWHFLHGKWNYF